MNLADWTDNQWVSVFAGEAEKILGKGSQEVGEAHEQNPDNLIEICNKANFSEYIFKCRAKFETYNVSYILDIFAELILNRSSPCAINFFALLV